MPQREQVLPVIAPDIGLVTGAPAHAIPDRGWQTVNNARFRKGRAEKVPGYIQVQAAALDGPVMGLYDFRTTTGYQAWVAVTQAKVWKKESVDATFVDITGGTALTGLNTEWVDMATYKDTLLITNGRDPIKKWVSPWGSGTTIQSLGGSPPFAKRVTVFQNHVLLTNINPVGGGTFSPQTIQWSDLGLMETWVGGEAGSLSLVDEPTALLTSVPLRDSLVCYKEDAIYLVDYTGFPFTMSTRRLATGIGPISSRIVVNSRDTHYFVSTDNQVYRLTFTGPEVVGQAVQFGLFNELNFQYRDRAFGMLNELFNEAIFVIPGGGSQWPSVGYILNYLDTKWGRRDLVNATAAVPRGARQLTGITWAQASGTWAQQTQSWASSQYATGANAILHGDTSGMVYKHTPGNVDANGVAINYDITSKMFDFGLPGKKKRLARLHIHYDTSAGTTLTLNVLTANGPGIPTTLNGPYTIVLDGTGNQWIDLDLTAVYFGFEFISNLVGQTVSLTGFAPTFYPEELT